MKANFYDKLQLLFFTAIMLSFFSGNYMVQAQGCHNAVTNGAFETDMSGWTLTGPELWTKNTYGPSANISTNNASDHSSMSQNLTNVKVENDSITVIFYTWIEKVAGNKTSLYVNWNGEAVALLYNASYDTPTQLIGYNGTRIASYGNLSANGYFFVTIRIPHTGASPASGPLSFTNWGAPDFKGYTLIDNIFVPSSGCPALTSTQPTFTCEPAYGYLFQNPNNTGPYGIETNTSAIRVNLATGASTVVKTALIDPALTDFSEINAVGYNQVDNYMWGYRRGTNQLVRIGSDWSVEYVNIPGLPGFPYASGEVDENGILYLHTQQEGSLPYLVRVNLNTLTVMPNIPLSQPIIIADFAVNPVDGFLYAFSSDRKLYRIDKATGAVTSWGPALYSGLITGTTTFGGSYFDNEGNFYISENKTSPAANDGGRIFRFDLVQNGNVSNPPLATFVANGPKTSSNDGARCASAPIVTHVITGNVWNDANGDALQNGTEPGFNTGSLSNNGVWANLVNGSGEVVNSVPVALDGTYTLYTDLPGTYSIILTPSEQTLNSVLAAGDVSNPWYFTGTNRSNGSPSTVNQSGIITRVTVTTINQVLEGYNFGIQQPPVADSYAFILSQAPASGASVVLNGSWPVSVSPTQLTGTDYEDGAYDGLLGSGSPTTIKIISEPIGIDGTPTIQPELYYNGVQVSAGDEIVNYNQNNLEVRLNGVGYKGFEFTYKTIDAAGQESNTATYKVTWPNALPVKLSGFTVSREGNIAQVKWSTTEEVNSDRFEIERSADTKAWTIIGSQQSSVESNATINYIFSDEAPLSGINYYRLKMIDQDRSYTYSRIQSISFDGTALKLIFHPNPVSDILYIKDNDGNAVRSDRVIEVAIVNSQGAVVYKSTSPVSTGGINVNGLAAGMYVVKITLTDGTLSTHKVVVNK